MVHYKILKNEVDNMVGAINGRYGTIGWNPIHYMYRSFGFEDLISLYLAADILFITPLRDGMNLIAKEYVAARQNKAGVLILGEMAGTAQELSEAIIINPNDLEATSRASGNCPRDDQSGTEKTYENDAESSQQIRYQDLDCGFYGEA